MPNWGCKCDHVAYQALFMKVFHLAKRVVIHATKIRYRLRWSLQSLLLLAQLRSINRSWKLCSLLHLLRTRIFLRILPIDDYHHSLSNFPSKYQMWIVLSDALQWWLFDLACGACSPCKCHQAHRNLPTSSAAFEELAQALPDPQMTLGLRHLMIMLADISMALRRKWNVQATLNPSMSSLFSQSSNTSATISRVLGYELNWQRNIDVKWSAMRSAMRSSNDVYCVQFYVYRCRSQVEWKHHTVYI